MHNCLNCSHTYLVYLFCCLAPTFRSFQPLVSFALKLPNIHTPKSLNFKPLNFHSINDSNFQNFKPSNFQPVHTIKHLSIPKPEPITGESEKSSAQQDGGARRELAAARNADGSFRLENNRSVVPSKQSKATLPDYTSGSTNKRNSKETGGWTKTAVDNWCISVLSAGRRPPFVPVC